MSTKQFSALTMSGYPHVLQQLEIVNQFFSHGKHMKNKRKGKMSWKIIPTLSYFPVAENDLQSSLRKSLRAI